MVISLSIVMSFDEQKLLIFMLSNHFVMKSSVLKKSPLQDYMVFCSFFPKRLKKIFFLYHLNTI